MRIEDYGFIGDTETGALVGRDGSIDWLCLPRFDSQACFASLLGDEDNGRWRLSPSGRVRNITRRYRPGSLVLETDFECDDGSVRVIDCMPLRGAAPDVVRVVRGLRGRVPMTMRLTIRFDYGRSVPWVKRHEQGLLAIAGPDALVLRTPVDTRGEDLTTVAEFSVAEGDEVPFVLTWFPSHKKPPRAVDASRAVTETDRWWRRWSDRCDYRGNYGEAVVRSLITLKGLTFAPTGGIVAAATTSLPEEIGGVRNWDYRYCWVRDATFTLYSLLSAGYTEEATAWRDWLLRAVAGRPSDLQIMYGPAGERWMPEQEVPWLAGYEGSTPVRIGNAASNQFQLDVYGELMDALHQARLSGIPPEDDTWQLQRALMDFLESHWDEPDDGIWEMRGPRRHFTHSKVMAWVAMDRAVKAVEQAGAEGPLRRWKQVRDDIHTEVCRKGFDAERKSFTQYYGSRSLDASLLMIPLVGFLEATDDRVTGTVEAIHRELCPDGFVARYLPRSEDSSDALPGGEGAFLACSFWLADNLCLQGRIDEATALFERLVGLGNDLGLLAEEYDPVRKRLVGNYPQAFSHVSLVNTARNLAGGGGPAHQRGKRGPGAAAGAPR